jgi:hypothetical protein
LSNTKRVYNTKDMPGKWSNETTTNIQERTVVELAAGRVFQPSTLKPKNSAEVTRENQASANSIPSAL